MKKTVNIPILARIEGEGALDLEICNNQIKKLNLNIYEPPRLFEKFLEGREYNEVIDMVARICGICPVAYQMSAAQAIENIFDIQISPWVRAMRRLFYCGEWIESHAIHIFFLAAPDFLGFNSAIEMAKKHPDELKLGVRLQALGHELISLFGGRPVNPVGACVGGFYRAPRLKTAKALSEKLKQVVDEVESLIHWIASFSVPDHETDFLYVALKHPNEYPMNEGLIFSNRGLNIHADEFENYFKESQVPHSTALHCALKGEDYLVGPLARLNLNYKVLPDPIKRIINEINLKLPTTNMFHSIIARAIEIYYSILEAIDILEQYEYTDQSCAVVSPKPGVGYGVTEAPRGLLWHRYEMDESGIVMQSNIVPPTSQNQFRIETDLKNSLTAFGLDNSDEALRKHSEMIIRNYDPCISCSTHFLDLRVKR